MAGDQRTYHAYIDESGQRAVTKRSSDHFSMSAVVIGDHNNDAQARMLVQLRKDLGRGVGDALHWQNLKPNGLRLAAATTLGRCKFVRIVSVVVCKRQLPSLPHEDLAYMYTFRMLLERLSWMARENNGTLSYTLAHVVRFEMKTLREYEERLRDGETSIRWEHLDPHGGYIDQPTRVEGLQLADLAASATGAAFDEPVRGSDADTRYIRALAPAFYRKSDGQLLSYGLKMHPWNDHVQLKYPWIAQL